MIWVGRWPVGLVFEWDGAKARENDRKHGVNFREAMTAFGDEHSVTIDGPAHSVDEARFVLVGMSQLGRLSCPSRKDTIGFLSSARESRRVTKDRNMKKASRTRKTKAAQMRGEYDFAGGTRGKYAKRFLESTNLVLLDPDVAEMFPTQAAVNNALRALARIIETNTPRRRSRKKDPSKK